MDLNSHDVDVKVKTKFIPEQSDTESDRFVFSYTIRIQNQSDQSVQLLERHWEISHADEQTQIVQGQGVVGKQPIIEPGSFFEYTSGSVLTTAVGCMAGHFLMQDAAGKQFLVQVPTFSLAVPNALH